MESFSREEIQDILSQLEQANYTHQQWYTSVIRSLICRLSPNKHDVRAHPHRECLFGQWYYEMAPDKLKGNPGFVALGVEHEKMHQLAAKLLLSITTNSPITPYDYDAFANSLERVRLELAVLQRELGDLLYNHDALTGAISRINMLPMLREQQALVKRKVQLCSIAMADLDHFKAINDLYGHAAGDIVLTTISRFIMENIRPYDKFFRIGGEEFLICFQNANTDLAFEIVERLRVGIATMQIPAKKELIKITVSFGITSIEADIPVEQAIELADKALYKAKNEGRNNTKIISLSHVQKK